MSIISGVGVWDGNECILADYNALDGLAASFTRYRFKVSISMFLPAFFSKGDSFYDFLSVLTTKPLQNEVYSQRKEFCSSFVKS